MRTHGTTFAFRPRRRIERPVTDAVRLFWRFVTTKYGIHPNPPTGSGATGRVGHAAFR